jgi:aryl-alcohol dehydrogenase-like predicted oxidoreductase
MNYRIFGRTGFKISEVSFGAWAIGADWGNVDDKDASAALRKAVETGINFFDTADVYGMGRSEKLVSQLRRDFGDTIIIATKAGRKIDPHIYENYTPGRIRGFVEDSLKNMGLEALDLVQLHCPPYQSIYDPAIYHEMDKLVDEGKLKNYGVSVEKVEEAMKAIEHPNVKTVQIIFNMFRQRPIEKFFIEAVERRIGIIVRVPLASGMLTGKMNKKSTFSKDDHRNYNREGKAFDVGETFSGVNFDKGLAAVEELKTICPEGATMPQFALQWILMHQAVSCVIPGAKNPMQVEDNAAASDLPPLSEEIMDRVRGIYEKYIMEDVHHRW